MKIECCMNLGWKLLKITTNWRHVLNQEVIQTSQWELFLYWNLKRIAMHLSLTQIHAKLSRRCLESNSSIAKILKIQYNKIMFENIVINEQKDYQNGFTKIVMKAELEGQVYATSRCLTDEFLTDDLNDEIIRSMKQELSDFVRRFPAHRFKGIWGVESSQGISSWTEYNQDIRSWNNFEAESRLAERMNRDFLGTMYNSIDSEDDSRCNWKKEGF